MAKMNWNRVQQQAKMSRPAHTPRSSINNSMSDIVEQWHIETYGCKPGEISRQEAERRLDALGGIAKSQPKKPPKPKKPKQPQLPLQVGGYRQCAGTTKSGERCKGGAQKGHDLCGPHLIKAAHEASF